MNVKTVLVLLVLALATVFALVCVLLTRERAPGPCPQQPPEQQQQQEEEDADERSLVFADLSAEELARVLRYLQERLGVPLVEASRALPSDNCVAWVDVQPPAKAEALRFLDGGGARPAREALAVLYLGAQAEPNVTEYVVGPLPEPTYHRDVTERKYGGKLPYHRRPALPAEYRQIAEFLKSRVFPTAPSFMRQVMEYNETNLAFVTAAPRGFQSGDRSTWFVLFQNVSGFFLHPVGLEVLVEHGSLDVSQWAVSRVFYNGQYHRDLAALESAYAQGRLRVEKVRKVPWDGDFSSMRPRAAPGAASPVQYEPQGPRYRVRKNHVAFQGWSFAFGMSVSRGLRLFDVRHRGERIAYEISVQEALSVYGSNCPAGMSTRYMDGSFGIGRFSSPLVRGVDCPYSATYVDVPYLAQSQVPRSVRNALCIFEHNLGSPLRRHYSNLQSLYYGGLVNSALVVRSITALGNYDYVWDFVFYQNGAMEGKVQATGYMSSSFLHGDGLRYGNRVWEHTLGTVHTHSVNYKVDLDVGGPEGSLVDPGVWEHTLGTIHTHSINYKVDLDVGGLQNSLVAQDMAFEMARAPWNPEQQVERPRLTKRVLDTEDQAAFRHQAEMPRYIYFAANGKNKWGHPRGYRIQLVSFAGEHMPEGSPMERAISWARYKLAVTKRKEEEPTSSSIYNQNDPWTPTVAFADFIDNETITNEDLVAWITTGFLHIPHSEDLPNTVTVGNSVGFLLRPYNYHDLDPSIYSPDGVFFTSEQDAASCAANSAACLPARAACLPRFPPFTYDGFRNASGL